MNVTQRTSWRPLQPVMALEDCPACGGTGWQTVEMGGVHAARRCTCSFLNRTLRLRETICIPPRYEGCSLAGFEPKTLSQHHALKAASRFVERFPRAGKGLFFTGPPGVGKTHLAVGILLALTARFHDDILFVDFPSLLEIAGPYGGPGPLGVPGSRAARASLVLLDNFGCCAASPENLRFTESLLDDRAAHGRISLFSGEPLHCAGAFRSSRQERDSATDRFVRQLTPASRLTLLTGNRLLPVNGEDFRCVGSGRTALFP